MDYETEYPPLGSGGTTWAQIAASRPRTSPSVNPDPVPAETPSTPCTSRSPDENIVQLSSNPIAQQQDIPSSTISPLPDTDLGLDYSARRTRDHQRTSSAVTPSTQHLQSAGYTPNRDLGVNSSGGYDSGRGVQEQLNLAASPLLQPYGLFQSPAMYQNPNQDPNTGGLSGSQRRGIYTEGLSLDDIASRLSDAQYESPPAQTSQSERLNPSYENGNYLPDMDRVASYRGLPTLRSHPVEQDMSGMPKESSADILSRAMRSSWRSRPRTNTNQFRNEPPAGSPAETSQRSRPRTDTNPFGDETPIGRAVLGGSQDMSPPYNQLSMLDRSPSSDSGSSEMGRRDQDRRRLRSSRSISQLGSAEQDMSRPYSQLSIQDIPPFIDARVPSGSSEIGRRGPTRIDLENWPPYNLKVGRTLQPRLGKMNQVSARDDAKVLSTFPAAYQTSSHTNQFASAGPNRSDRQGLFANQATENKEVEGFDPQKRQLALLEGRLVYFGNLRTDDEDSHLFQLLLDSGFNPVSVRVYSYSGNNYSHKLGLVEFETTVIARRAVTEFNNQSIRESGFRVRLALPSDGLPIVARLQPSTQADRFAPVSGHGRSLNTFDEFDGQLHRGEMGALGRNAVHSAREAVVSVLYRVHVGGLPRSSTPKVVNDIFIRIQDRVVGWGPLREWRADDGQNLLFSFAEFSSEQEAYDVYESCVGDVNYCHLKFWVGPATGL